ncbi:helix-turn-helix domain-containing protein [Pseudomonas aeruginosa]
MSTIGERLREERERKGMNQSSFAEVGGVQKRAQINYEKDERHPDAAYLAAIAAAGVDVLYVLTGQRAPLATDQAYVAPSQHMTEKSIQSHAQSSLNRLASTGSISEKRP